MRPRCSALGEKVEMIFKSIRSRQMVGFVTLFGITLRNSIMLISNYLRDLKSFCHELVFVRIHKSRQSFQLFFDNSGEFTFRGGIDNLKSFVKLDFAAKENTSLRVTE